jgi:hypothetical protein
MEKLDMNTLKNIVFGTDIPKGEKIAGLLIIAMVIYLFIAQ